MRKYSTDYAEGCRLLDNEHLRAMSNNCDILQLNQEFNYF